jgi:hypothetical protein
MITSGLCIIVGLLTDLLRPWGVRADPEPRIFAGFFFKHIRPHYARGAHTHGHARGP